MIFASLSVVYADAALPPRPRNVQSDFLTADIDDDGQLTLKFSFSAACDYEYQLIDRWEGSKEEIHRNEVKSGKGSYKVGDVVEEVVNLKNRIMPSRKNYFVLKVHLSNIKEKTRFGSKVRRGKIDVTKTIIIETSYWNKAYGFHIYNGDID